jgi:hypothetical protein
MIKPSSRKDKRFMLEIDGKKIHFGSPTGFTFVDGASEKTKENYLKRHAVNEDWTKINAGSLSRFILWDSRNLETNIKSYFKKFGIKKL